MDKPKGMEKLEAALEIIEQVIKEKQGQFKLLQKPQLISGDDTQIVEDEDGVESGDEDSENNEEGIDVDLEGEEEDKDIEEVEENEGKGEESGEEEKVEKKKKKGK